MELFVFAGQAEKSEIPLGKFARAVRSVKCEGVVRILLFIFIASETD